eukprot:TRINITY_DN10888_c0_g2_i1.p1 TRINITY_DN10888_c0_g2~~TRINITY_DN10888_c0_g2_i1.p1  ORF type:complete len:771 (+),score=115.94 TRINITY_DN10888_c0_g2_i1:125-2437(+)
MGNRLLCSDASLRCAERCSLLPPDFLVSVGDGSPCEPAGAVFGETLEGLCQKDKQLLLFASSSNVVAVQWLLALRANVLASDSNATSCLHAACRSGSPTVVRQLLARREDAQSMSGHKSGRHAGDILHAMDCVCWTPLHIAASMGRAEVVSLLVKARARLQQRTLNNQTALDLCFDARCRAVLQGADITTIVVKGVRGADEASESSPLQRESTSVEDAVKSPRGTFSEEADDTGLESSMRFEPYFVPRASIIRTFTKTCGGDRFANPFYELCMSLGRDIFNHQPGRGLAFLIASGCTRDYPVELVAVMRSHGFDMRQVGTFLGEDFSLSKIMRLEFINSVDLRYHGIIYSLQKVFLGIKAPSDLQKVNRLAEGVADIWWRQHCRSGVAKEDNGRASLESEARGYDLKAMVPNLDALRQIVFSAILLHRSFHDPAPDEEPVSEEEFVRLHEVLTEEAAGQNGGLTAEGLEAVLRQLYTTLEVLKISNLLTESIPVPEKMPRTSSLPGDSMPKRRRVCAVAQRSDVEGWARLGGGDTQQGLGRLSECSQLWHVFSEATASSRRPTSRQVPTVGRQAAAAVASMSLPAASVQSSTRRPKDAAAKGDVWLSLCDSLLFISAGPEEGAPIAFCHLEDAQFAGMEPSHGRMTIQSAPPPLGQGAVPPPLKLVFLLADGRWRTLDLSQLEIEVSDRGQLEAWVNAIARLALLGSSCKVDADFQDVVVASPLEMPRPAMPHPSLPSDNVHRGRKSAQPRLPQLDNMPLEDTKPMSPTL